MKAGKLDWGRYWAGALLASLVVAGCSTTVPEAERVVQRVPVGKMLDYDPADLSAQQNYWMEQINQFYQADLRTVVYPHAELVNALNQTPEEQYCSAAHLRTIEQALQLNSTSLIALTFTAHCANRMGDQPTVEQAQQGLNYVAELLFHTGSGETPYDPVQIRDLYEAQIVFQWAGINVFDVELVHLRDDVVLRLHSLDSSSGEYRVYYASNSRYVAKNVNHQVNDKQLAEVLLTSLLNSRATPAVHWQHANWLRNDKPQAVQTELSAKSELSALDTVLLAQAYFHQRDMHGFERQVDSLLTYSEGGFVEASATLGQYLLRDGSAEERANAINLYGVNVERLGAYQTTRMWLEAFLRQPQPEILFAPFIQALDMQYYPQWLRAIYQYNHRFGETSAIINNKLTILLLTLAEQHPQAQLNYAYLLLEGGWGIDQDVPKGLQMVKLMAESGFATAQLNYGIYFSSGLHGLPQDREQAFYWYQQAAAQDNPSALYNVALGYRYARGTDQDLGAAMRYFQRSWDTGFGLAGCRIADILSEEQSMLDYANAASIYQQVLDNPESSAEDIAVCAYGLGFIQVHEFEDFSAGIESLKRAGQLGEKHALFELGLIYSDGIGVPVDKQQAIDFYQQAIDLGSYRAAANLGFLYETGDGVAVDKQRALAYYQLSAEGGSATGQNNYATFLRYGTQVEQDVVAAQALYRLAYQQRSPHAAENLADMHYYGELGEPDYTQACDYYQQALEWGAQDALFDVAYCYLYGEGREQDIDKGIELLQRSAKLNNTDAMVKLGDIYALGEAVSFDPDKALQYYLQAYQHQHAQAAYGLGYLHEQAEFTGVDPVLARVYYEQSAKWGWIDGMLATARAYLQGFGTRPDKQKAIYWLQQAQQKGSQEATKMLKGIR